MAQNNVAEVAQHFNADVVEKDSGVSVMIEDDYIEGRGLELIENVDAETTFRNHASGTFEVHFAN